MWLVVYACHTNRLGVQGSKHLHFVVEDTFAKLCRLVVGSRVWLVFSKNGFLDCTGNHILVMFYHIGLMVLELLHN